MKKLRSLLGISLLIISISVAFCQIVRADEVYYTWDSADYDTDTSGGGGLFDRAEAKAYADTSGLVRVKVYILSRNPFTYKIAKAWANLYKTVDGVYMYITPSITYEAQGGAISGSTRDITLRVIDKSTDQIVSEASEELPQSLTETVTRTLVGPTFHSYDGRQYMYVVNVYLRVAGGGFGMAQIDYWSDDSHILVKQLYLQYSGGGSCPFVYSSDGQQHHFEHEAYPFAVMKSAETTSYDRLKYLKEVDGEYRLKIKQVLHEIDWTDSFDLYVVDHPNEDSFVMPDLDGNLHTVKGLIQPISAYEKNGDDCLEDVKYFDDKAWKDDIFDADVNDESTLRNWIVLTFPKPEGTTEAKLLLSVKKQITITQEWEFFINLIGENYWNLWQKIMENPTLTELFLDMYDREITLRMEVWNGAEWVLQDTISAGDSLWDDFLAVLDISDVGGDELQIRLKSTTAHYEINYVSIDYSEDEPMIVHKIDPYYAVKNGEEDVLAALEKSDENYVTLLPNDVIELSYKAIPQSEWKRDFTIATKGYYNFVDFQDQTLSGFIEGTALWLEALTQPYFVPKTVFPYLQQNAK